MGGRKVLVVVGVLVVAAAAAFFLLRNGSPPSVARKVTIAQAADVFLYAPLYVAKDAGYFGEADLDVTLVTTGGDEKTWAAVVSGSAAFGVADPTFVAVSAERNQPGTVVATVMNGVPFWGVTFRKDIPSITRPEELNGYRVATFPSPSTAYTLQHKMFADGGLSPKIVEGAFGTLLAMLEADRADIALELEPNVSQATSKGARIVYALPDRYGDFTMTGLTTLPETITRDPELVRKVVCALEKAMQLLHLDQPRCLALLRVRFPELSESVAKDALARAVAAKVIPSSPRTAAAAWDKAIQLRLASGDLKRDLGYAHYVNDSFAASAPSTCR